MTWSIVKDPYFHARPMPMSDCEFKFFFIAILIGLIIELAIYGIIANCIISSLVDKNTDLRIVCLLAPCLFIFGIWYIFFTTPKFMRLTTGLVMNCVRYCKDGSNVVHWEWIKGSEDRENEQ